MWVPRAFSMQVLPFSLWLAYDVADVARLNAHLPPGLEAASIRILQDDAAPAPKLLFNAYALSLIHI